jgi:outer membrane protein assembly factor BamB
MIPGLFVALALVPAAAPASDWPQFRGPTGDGAAAASADPPVEWVEAKNVAWKTAVPGRGRSSPVVVGDRVFLTTAVERGVKRTRIGADDMQTAEHVDLGAVCLDRATGKILWHVTLRAVDNPEPVHWLNSWATPTPVAAPGRVWCDFGAFGTWCLDAETGKTVWEKRLPIHHMVGPGSSPVLAGDRLILVRDGCDTQYVTALDKATGAEAWKTPRPPIKPPDNSMKKSFSSPLLIPAGGRTQLVSSGPHWVVSYDPGTGKELWRANHGMGFSIGSCPVFGGGLLVFSTGCFKPVLVAVRPDGQGDVTATHIAWRSQKGIPVMSSPVLAGEELYWVSDDGMATCADLKTGEARWQERLGGEHLASPILAAGRLYFWCKDGKTTVVKPGRTFEKLAENRLEGLVTATPAVVDKAIFLRTDTHLCRIEKR